MTTSIRRPGVEIAQEFVTSSPTISTPTLAACLVGPCFRIISALDDDGEPQSDAYAGTYQDGYGTVAYDLPSLGGEDDLSTLTDEIRVFLALGGDVTELNAESDEEVIAEGTGSGDYDDTAGTFTDSAATFLQLGVESGDVVRVSWRGDTVDIPITVDAASDTVLTVGTDLIGEDLTSIDYEIVRNPAQFVFDASAQADYRYGTEDDYIVFAATALALDAVTAADYAGSLGDDLTVVIAETEEIASGTSIAAIGDSVFIAASATFVTDIGATGAPASTTYMVVGASGSGAALREIVYVVSETTAIIETGTGTVSGQAWLYGTEVETGSAGVYDHTGGTYERSLTDAGATWAAPGAGYGNAPDATTYVEIEGSGVYLVATVESATEITLDAGSNPGIDVASSAWTAITEVDNDAAAADGATQADTYFLDPTATFQTDGVTASYSVDVSGDSVYAVSAVVSETVLTLASATDGASLTYEVVDTTATLAITWDADEEEITITLGRTAGVSTNTYAQVNTAFTDDGDASYNATVAEFFVTSLGGDTGDGSSAFTDADVGSYALDGGADEEQLILDADLIGSSTPVGKIYVSYKALRVDVSAGAASPDIVEYESTTDAADGLGDPTTDNPLSLAFYYALLNAPSQAVKGIGIDEITATKPNGTLESYAAALEFLEGREVYSLVPLTQDPSVHAIFQTHTDSMSDSDNRGERITLFSQAFPSYATATTVASGTEGNTGDSFVGSAVGEFTTSVDLTAAGVEAGHYLVVSAVATSDESPDGVNGTQALYGVVIEQVKTGDDFTLIIDATDRTVVDDGQLFNWSSDDWDSLVDVTWSVYEAGAAITAKSAQRDAVAEIGENFADRRMFHVWPPQVVGDVGGSSAVLEGYYLAAAVAGWISEKNPSKALTNSTVAGFNGLKYSNSYFSDSQLNRIAGGGQMIFIQESSGGSLKCRHQLSTDTSTIQYREMSITKAIDYVAKFFRNALTSQIGVFNITQSFLDSLSVRIQGLGRFLTSAGIVNDFDLTTIEVDADDPSKVVLVANLDVLYPCNTIYMTLQI